MYHLWTQLKLMIAVFRLVQPHYNWMKCAVYLSINKPMAHVVLLSLVIRWWLGLPVSFFDYFIGAETINQVCEKSTFIYIVQGCFHWHCGNRVIAPVPVKTALNNMGKCMAWILKNCQYNYKNWKHNTTICIFMGYTLASVHWAWINGSSISNSSSIQ